ncbi:uncharacterized protein B0H18DRAFT_960894 [Fomitopsis serialis]|uniref:uncharacterized protein n=1 Tax=Fomitopsis serialis TaxID=139415 RepID=UPI002007FA9C|nr:uncharacterized protein B0H18DRAFT_960894 [Neoantrodia serialis]KAH9912653.1 hypothetical protein B0H18DRAFT_960894 [Neoantrodia serialis]
MFRSTLALYELATIPPNQRCTSRATPQRLSERYTSVIIYARSYPSALDRIPLWRGFFHPLKRGCLTIIRTLWARHPVDPVTDKPSTPTRKFEPMSTIQGATQLRSGGRFWDQEVDETVQHDDFSSWDQEVAETIQSADCSEQKMTALKAPELMKTLAECITGSGCQWDDCFDVGTNTDSSPSGEENLSPMADTVDLAALFPAVLQTEEPPSESDVALGPALP